MTSTVSNNILESASQCLIQQDQKYSAFTWTIGQLILGLKVYFLVLNINIVKSHLQKTATRKNCSRCYRTSSAYHNLIFGFPHCQKLCSCVVGIKSSTYNGIKPWGQSSSLAPGAVSFSSSQDSWSLGHCLGSPMVHWPRETAFT